MAFRPTHRISKWEALVLVFILTITLNTIVRYATHDKNVKFAEVASARRVNKSSNIVDVALSRAYDAWTEMRHSGMEPTRPRTSLEGDQLDEKHFAFTLYDQPVHTSTDFDIRVVNAANSSHIITGRIGSGADTAALHDSLRSVECMERVFCKIPMGSSGSRSQLHLPHFAQIALPCWSALQRFPPSTRAVKCFGFGNGWIGELMEAFQTAGITVIHMENNIFTGSEQCDWEVKFQKVPNGWPERPALHYDEDGVLLTNHDDYNWKKHPTFYFSRPSDAAALQRVVLGSNYTYGVSKEPKTRVLILNRSTTRQLSYGHAIVSSLKSSALADVIEVVYVNEMLGSLHHQALTIHSADIIISPHGAQLTNLAFIKPCTVVAELFPRGYYLHFFQTYVVAAGGIAFEGYEDGRSAYFDLFGIEESGTRRKRRGQAIPVSAASVVRAMPEFILKFNTCRSNYMSKNG